MIMAHQAEILIPQIVEEKILENSLEIFKAVFSKYSTVEFALKGDGSLVSNLELSVEKEISTYLMEKTPWAGFRGEEGIEFEPLTGPTGYKWYLDPIDGTISFCNGLDTFAFTMTLVHDNEAVAALVYFPRLEKTYTAFKDGGAFLNGKKLSIHARPQHPKMVFAVSDRYTFEMVERENVLKTLLELPYITRTITDIYGYCMVAEGKCGGKFDAAGALWDLWPGYLLIQEAGGECLYFPVENPTDDLAGSMLIGNKRVVSEVYESLKALLPPPQPVIK
jgi:myo-inositol-1(or 4)-monophosphatase